MKKEEFIKRYGKERYEKYLKKQAELTRKWRKKNLEKSRTYGRKYYWRMKENEEGRK